MRASLTEFQLAWQCHQRGDLAKAKALYGRVGMAHPDYPRALHYLGLIAHQTGDSAQGVRLISRALALTPKDAEMRSNLGNALARCGRLQEARDELEKATALAPGFAGAHNNLGLVQRKLGDPEAAAGSFERAVQLAPGQPLLYSNWGTALAEAGQLTAAREKLEQAIKLNPGHADAWSNLGLVHSRLRAWDEAVRCLNKALELAPEAAGVWVNLSNVERAFGRMSEARKAAAKAIELAPGLPDAHQALASAGRFEEAEREITGLEAVLKRGDLTPKDRINCSYALGKLLDGAGQFDRAFAAYAAANAEQAQPVEIADSVTRFDRLIARFDRDLLDRLADVGNPSERPIFVVGMPRSGTTLVEQIIASHGAASGAGELPHFEGYLKAFEAAKGGSRAALLGDFAQDYLARLDRRGERALRTVDKAPFNFLCLGLIRLVFPKARIVHCRRDPRDTCLSIFFTNFAEHRSFTTRLADIGAYYACYKRLMEQWRQLFPEGFFEIAHETLVRDQEGETRRLLGYLGLPWDERCLSFHETLRPVDTPSDWQVREPIHTRSLGRWRHYERHLAPLLEALPS